MREPEPIVLALASDEGYFPGLYCAVASALRALDPLRDVDVKVLDGGLSQQSRDSLAKLIGRTGKRAQLEFTIADASIFDEAALGPGQSHMAYCRILLPHLLGVSRLIYLDCDVLVFRDLSQLFDFDLPDGKVVAAVPDSETCSLAADSRASAKAMKLPAEGTYFNSGVILMNLDELRKQRFFERAVEFLTVRKLDYQFHDQSAINFLLHQCIQELPEYWNRPSWCFDQQENNNLDCVLHYTNSVPWRSGTPGPAQHLFERVAADVGLPVDRDSPDFKNAKRERFWQNIIAPLRALIFPIVSLFYRVIRRNERSAAYLKVGRYWWDYIRSARNRRRLYRRRSEEISRMKFDLRTSPLTS
jgi:lipopolysaccharide biosynthesis glycosyltransferase